MRRRGTSELRTLWTASCRSISFMMMTSFSSMTTSAIRWILISSKAAWRSLYRMHRAFAFRSAISFLTRERRLMAESIPFRVTIVERESMTTRSPFARPGRASGGCPVHPSCPAPPHHRSSGTCRSCRQPSRTGVRGGQALSGANPGPGRCSLPENRPPSRGPDLKCLSIACSPLSTGVSPKIDSSVPGLIFLHRTGLYHAENCSRSMRRRSFHPGPGGASRP